ncbi:MAG: Crp/Fnr family transcriptional regulator [Paludibacter sp.]
MTEVILQTLSRYTPISAETAKALSNVAEIKQLAEYEFLEKESSKISSEFIVLEGIVRAYVSDYNGEDITINFYSSGQAITPAILRGVHSQSAYNLQVLSKTASILIFNNTRMENEMQHFPDLQQFGYNVIMQDSLRRVEREVVLLKETARNKLNWFRKNFPGLENQVQHYHIASFLGITPTSLSRIRAEI